MYGTGDMKGRIVGVPIDLNNMQRIDETVGSESLHSLCYSVLVETLL